MYSNNQTLNCTHNALMQSHHIREIRAASLRIFIKSYLFDKYTQSVPWDNKGTHNKLRHHTQFIQNKL